MPAPYLPLEAWNKNWSLEGNRLRCRRCRASHSLTDDSAFSHTLGCNAWGLQAPYPRRELAVIPEQKTQAGLF